MSNWEEKLVTTFSTSMGNRRRELGLSAQKLADRTEALGHPVNRSTVAALENGHRDRLLLSDALVLAQALGTPLAQLLYPEMPDGQVEYVPNQTVAAWDAALALVGTQPLDAMPTAMAATASDEEAAKQYEEERQAGHELMIAALLLADARETRADVLGDFDSQEAFATPETRRHLLSMLGEAERRIGELAERVKSLGGVVSDG